MRPAKGITVMLTAALLLGGPLMAVERDSLMPRVPPDQLPIARATKNPIRPTPENLAKGKDLYNGKAACIQCHGAGGQGDGDLGKFLEPSPSNFTNQAFHQAKTPGELMWVLKNGLPDSGMTALVPTMISEEEAWLVISYERSLAGLAEK